MNNNFVQPYLFFSGRCEEALNFYHNAVSAQIGMVMRFNESPTPPPPGTLQPGFENKVMHSEFKIGESTILASDGCDDKTKPSGFSLALIAANESEANRTFDGLSKDGSIQMPLTKTFWSPSYGMLTDKFGISWMVMVLNPEPK